MFYKVNFPNFNYKKFLRTSAIVLYTKHSMDVLTQNSWLWRYFGNLWRIWFFPDIMVRNAGCSRSPFSNTLQAEIDTMPDMESVINTSPA